MKRWVIVSILAILSVSLCLLFLNADFQLNTAKAELDYTEKLLDWTKTELTSALSELELNKAKLSATEAELEATSSTLATTRTELLATETELASASVNLITTQTELDTVQDTLTDLEISYEGLMTGHGYTIKDPTYNEMMRFLRTDKTDKAQYIEDEYVCTDFATALCNNAESYGIRCAYVTINYPEGGHAIVAFNTIDKGLTYIEPQSDNLVKIVIGRHFYQCIVPASGQYYVQPDYDDTIEKVLVVW